MDVYPQRFLRTGTLGILLLHMFRRPMWTYSDTHANWYNQAIYPSFNLARIPLDTSYVLDIVLQGLVTWGLYTILKRPRPHLAPLPKSRVKILTNYAAPICGIELVNCLVQLGVFAATGKPARYTLSPLEAVLFILCEPCFESTLYRTMYRSIPYFGGLMFLLVVVVLSWSVLAMVVINSGRQADPRMTSLMDCIWNMLTVLNTANWPNPTIPSYDSNTAYFTFFIAYSVVVDWGFLNLVLGLIVAFFEASWLNDAAADAPASNAKAADQIRGDASPDVASSAVTQNPLQEQRQEQNAAPVEIEMVEVSKAAPQPVPTSAVPAGKGQHTERKSLMVVPLAAHGWWITHVGPFVENKVFDLATDFTLFVLGFNFVFGNVPKTFLTVQVILNGIELVLRISIKKMSFIEWIYVFRNLSNAVLITVLFITSQTYFGLCGAGSALDGTPSCEPRVLNDALSPALDRQIVLIVILIRTCILVRISLVMRNFGWDYIPVAWQQQLTRASAIIGETSKALSHLVIMLLTMMYIFTSIGCSIWGGKLNKDPSQPDYVALMQSSYALNRYWPLNFNDMFGGFVTMFTLLYINNMQIITDGCSAVSSVNARWFFVLFYIFGVLYVRNIFTSFLWSRIGKILDTDSNPIEDEPKPAEAVQGEGAGMVSNTVPKQKQKSVVRLQKLLRTELSAKNIFDDNVDQHDLDNVHREHSSGLTLAERACLLLFSAKTGLRLKLDHSALTVKAYKLLKKMEKHVLVACWLLTFLRIFQKPPWLQNENESQFQNYMFSRTPFMAPSTKAFMKVPLLMFLQGMLTLEAISTRGGWTLVSVSRYCLMAINFASFCCSLIGGITDNDTAKHIDFYLSFFSIIYTFWFDPNALKRIKIVSGVVPMLFGLCLLFFCFVCIMALYGDFMFGLTKLSGDDDDYNASYYASYGNSIWTTAVAITSSSYPSQFMPVLRAYKEYSVFLLLVISVGGFVILEGSIAVVNTAYQNGVQAKTEYTIQNQKEAVEAIFLSLAAAKKIKRIKATAEKENKAQAVLEAAEPEQPVDPSENEYIDAEYIEAMFKELFESFSQSNGCAGLAERAILRTILDFDNDGKISRDDFDLLVHVAKIHVVRVPPKFLTPKEKRQFHEIKHRIREDTEKTIDATSAWAKRFYRMKVFREGCSFSIRKWAESTWMNVLEKKHYDLVADSIAGLVSVFAVLSRGSPELHEAIALLLMFFFILEFFLKVFLLNFGPYMRDVRNLMDLAVGGMMFVFLLGGSSTNSLFQGKVNFWSIGLDIVEMLRMLLYPRNVACFASPVNGIAWKSVLATIGKLSFAFAEAFTCVGFTYAQIGLLLFGGDIPKPGVNAVLDKSPFGQNNFYILNFNDMTSSFFTLFCCLRVSDWDVVTNGYKTMRGTDVRIYFVGWYVLGVLLMFNILKSYFVIVFRPKGSVSSIDEDMAIDEDATAVLEKFKHSESVWEREEVFESTEQEKAVASKEAEAGAGEEDELNMLDARNVSGGFIMELDTLLYPKNPLASDNVKFVSVKADKEGFVDGIQSVSDEFKSYNSWDRASTHSMAEVDKKYRMVLKHNAVRYHLFLPYKNTMEDEDRLKILRRLAKMCTAEC